MKPRGGFTLIEMLVVVGMIGVLAAAVLTALGPSRQKARDTRIISAVNQIAALTETTYDGTKYSDPATGVTAVSYTSLTADITANGGTPGKSVAASTFVIWGTLASDDKKSYCVDSTGARKTTSIPAAGATVCP